MSQDSNNYTPGHLHSFFVPSMGKFFSFFDKMSMPEETWTQLELTDALHIEPTDFLLNYLTIVFLKKK